LLTGVVYGIGAETFVLPNLSVRLEALHYDYGSEERSKKRFDGNPVCAELDR
jgi:hypothetical protein